MASTGVEILISADDQASAKFDDVEKSLRAVAEEEKRQQKIAKESAANIARLRHELAVLNATDEERIEILARHNAHSEEEVALARQVLVTKQQLADAAKQQAQQEREQENAFRKKAGQVKASTELVGTFSNMLGATPLGAFAGGLAQMTERMSAFSEVSKEGGAGATIFKVGILAAAGALAFKLGKAIGDTIFQTEKMNREFEKTVELSSKITDQIVARQESRFARDVADLEEITDLEDRRVAAMQKQAAIDNEIASKKELVAKLTEKVAGRTETWSGWAASTWGEYEKTTETLQQQLADNEKILESLREQSSTLSQIGGIEEQLARAKEKQKENEERLADWKKEVAAEEQRLRDQEQARLEASEQYVDNLQVQLDMLKAQQSTMTAIAQMEASGNLTSEDADEARKIQKQIDAQKMLAEFKKEAAAEETAIREAESAKHDNLVAMRQELELLKAKDKTLADIARQVLGGQLKESDAEEALRLQRAMGELEKEGKSKSGPTSLSASEGRLLSRGTATSAIDKTAKNTEETVKGVRELIAAVKEGSRQQTMNKITFKKAS